MDTLEQLKLYDTILNYVKSHAAADGKLPARLLSPLGRQLVNRGTTLAQFEDAKKYLVATEHLTLRHGVYYMAPNGYEKLLHPFEEGYIRQQKDRELQNNNLIETTELAIAQKRDIRGARNRSWWAIGISILAFILSVISTYKEHFNEGKDNSNGNHQSKKERLDTIHKDSVRISKKFADSLK